MNTLIGKSWKFAAYAVLAFLTVSFLNFAPAVNAVVSGDLDIVETDGSTIVTEGGATDTFTISRVAEVTGNDYFTYSYVPQDPRSPEITVSPESVEFNSSNWNTPVTITVSAIEDESIENIESEIVNFQLSGQGGLVNESALETQNIIENEGVEVDIIDDDGILIDGYTPGMAIEEGGSVILSLSLGTSPEFISVRGRDITLASNNNPVEVLITTPDFEGEPEELLVSEVGGEELSFSPTSLSFVPNPNINLESLNFDLPQTLVITAADNEDLDGDRDVNTLLSVDAAGNNFDVLDDISLSFTIVDEDEPEIVCVPGEDNLDNDCDGISNADDDCDEIDDDCDGIVCDPTAANGEDNDCDGYPNSGDANNDGTTDNLQDNVVTTRGENDTITVKTEAPISNVEQVVLTKEIDKSTPLLAQASVVSEDILSFEAEGAETEVELFFRSKKGYDAYIATNLRAAKIDPDTGETIIIEDAEISLITIDGEEVVKVTYTLVDGSEYDSDGEVNGVMVDPVGIIALDEEVVAEGDLIRTGGADNGYSYLAIVSLLVLAGSVVQLLKK